LGGARGWPPVGAPPPPLTLFNPLITVPEKKAGVADPKEERWLRRLAGKVRKNENHFKGFRSPLV
jgi:hypothetical protein